MYDMLTSKILQEKNKPIPTHGWLYCLGPTSCYPKAASWFQGDGFRSIHFRQETTEVKGSSPWRQKALGRRLKGNKCLPKVNQIHEPLLSSHVPFLFERDYIEISIPTCFAGMKKVGRWERCLEITAATIDNNLEYKMMGQIQTMYKWL